VRRAAGCWLRHHTRPQRAPRAAVKGAPYRARVGAGCCGAAAAATSHRCGMHAWDERAPRGPRSSGRGAATRPCALGCASVRCFTTAARSRCRGAQRTRRPARTALSCATHTHSLTRRRSPQLSLSPASFPLLSSPPAPPRAAHLALPPRGAAASATTRLLRGRTARARATSCGASVVGCSPGRFWTRRGRRCRPGRVPLRIAAPRAHAHSALAPRASARGASRPLAGRAAARGRGRKAHDEGAYSRLRARHSLPGVVMTCRPRRRVHASFRCLTRHNPAPCLTLIIAARTGAGEHPCLR
jgi:hypothetical protein